MKIWLDDERDPQLPYIQERFGATPDMVWCKTIGVVQHAFETGNVSFISFDHDLGSGCMTGYDLAKWLEERAANGLLPRFRWRIHSQSNIGRENIKAALRKITQFWLEQGI